MARVAFMTSGVLQAEWGDPQVQGFVDRVPINFQTADGSPGFITRSDDDPPHTNWGGELVIPRTLDRPEFVGKRVFTLTLWQDLESVFAFSYNASHGESLRHRTEWFVKGDFPGYVAWWVDDDYTPSWQEAADRLDQLTGQGASPQAFDFKHPFDARGQPTVIDRQVVRTRAAALPELALPEANNLAAQAPISADQVERLIATYLAAWNEPDPVTRLGYLETAWFEQGEYTDPQSHALGRQALNTLIGGFHTQNPGAKFHLEGKIDFHHIYLRFFWCLAFANGARLPGMDYAEIGPEGRLTRIVGFF